MCIRDAIFIVLSREIQTPVKAPYQATECSCISHGGDVSTQLLTESTRLDQFAFSLSYLDAQIDYLPMFLFDFLRLYKVQEQ